MSDFSTKRHLERGEIDCLDALKDQIQKGAIGPNTVINGVDLEGFDQWNGCQLEDVIFLGCRFKDLNHRRQVEDLGAYIFPRLNNLPYEPFRNKLYSVDELLNGYDEFGYAGTRDFKIYEHFDRARRKGFGVTVRETLAQRLHDHAIDDALVEVLQQHSGKGVVGIMGGHSTKRNDVYFRKVAMVTWALTREGYFIASGGGPGIMEAANLGAWLANYANPMVIDAAIEILSQAPKFDGGHEEGSQAYLDAIGQYVACARQVIQTFSGDDVDTRLSSKYVREHTQPGSSLAIPTWFYGHEPTNLFGDHVAKYFSNSLREDGLLAISLGGVVYAPGSAGTWQEIFMDLAQNHYATFQFRSPMVFLGQSNYEAIYGLIRQFIQDRKMTETYGHLLGLFDDPWDVVRFIQGNPPERRTHRTPLYELL